MKRLFLSLLPFLVLLSCSKAPQMKSVTGPRILNVNADDLCLDEGTDNAILEDLSSIIRQLPQGVSEMMCHPGIPGETKILADPAVRKKMEECHILLSNYNCIRKTAR